MAKVSELLVPYDRGDVLAAVRREGEVVSEEYDSDAVRVRARLSAASAGRLDAFIVAPGQSDRAASEAE
jgi:GTP-binding protein HflX